MTFGPFIASVPRSTRPGPIRRIGRAGLITAVALGALALAPSSASATVTCGSATTVGSDVVVTFASSCTWTVPAGVTTVDALVVAGGGGSASDGSSDASGGGAGGLVYRTGSGNSGFTLAGSTVSVTVGTGGAGDSTCSDGSNGTGSAFGTLVATGGGGGSGGCSGNNGNGYGGGSGGGAADCYNFNRVGGAADTSGGQQAHAGGGVSSNYCSSTGGGGGGGAGTAGQESGVPGAGLSISITGSAVTYAAGGAANTAFDYATQSPAAAYPSIGGGGRSSVPGGTADSGADGTVIVRYTAVAAPGSPGTPTAVAGDARATVTITAPSTGGTPTSYTVTAVQSPFTSCTITLPATSCTVTGLTNGSGYTFSSTATNAVGTSGASAASSTVTPTLTAPGTPGTPTAVAGDSTVRVTVTAPSSGGAVAGYTVTTVQTPARTCTITAPATSCSINGLINGAGYTFTSTATNAAGTSGASAASSPAVTPLAGNPGSPAAPGPVTAVAGTASLRVSWPAVNGAVRYVATAHPGPSSCTVIETSCLLGAVAGTAYTVTVVAQSGGGDSPASVASAPVTPTAPGIPSSPPAGAPSTLTTDRGPIGVTTTGQQITLTGTGFAPYSTTTGILYSTPTNLGSAVTDATGAFSLLVTVPADLPAGAHTFLASGVGADGGIRQLALPVTVASHTGTEGTLPVPAGGTITLLDTGGLAVTTVTVPQGRYVLNPATGVIDFEPITGFTGTADGVRYRLTDAMGTVVTGIHTAVVPGDPPFLGRGRLPLPGQIIAGTSAGVPCAISRGVIAACSVTATASVRGRRVIVGRGSVQPVQAQEAQQVTVPVALTAAGRALTARPGGVRLAFTATLAQRDHTGTATVRGATVVLARTFALQRAIVFRAGSAAVTAADAAYLNTVRQRLAGATAITCIGHADRRDGSAAGTLGARRARAACAVLSQDLDVTVHLEGRHDRAPTGANDTAAARARNRRVDIAIRN